MRGGAAEGRGKVCRVDVLVQLCVLVQEEDLGCWRVCQDRDQEREGKRRKDLVFGAGIENSFHHRPDHVHTPVMVHDIKRAQSVRFGAI